MSVLTASRGLITQASELTRPDGALSKADNAVIDFDNVIQQRRGFKDYSQVLATPPKQLLTYKNKVLVHYGQTLAADYLSGGSFSAFLGSYAELVPGLRIKYLETNGNLYFTTKDGVKKVSVKSASDLASAKVTQAGGIKAIDLTAKPVPEVSGFLPPQSKTAYRILFGTKDANTNLIRGVPSSRVIVTNASRDVNRSEIFTVNVLNPSTITDKKYLLFNTKSTNYFVYYTTVAPASAAAPVTADTLDRVGIQVNLFGLTLANTPASAQQVAAYTANAMQSALPTQANIVLNTSEVEVTITDVGDVTDASQGTLLTSEVLISKVIDGSTTAGIPAKALITFTLPQNASTDYFYQIYRTGVASVTQDTILNDVDPGDEMNFVSEAPVLAADVLAGTITVEDNTPDNFRISGENLYTNQYSGEGITQANERPPIAQDIALFRNSTFYANTKDVHRLSFGVLSVDDLVSGQSKFYISKEDTTVFYTFKGVVEKTDITVLPKSQTVGNSYITLNSANNERSFYIWNDKGSISKTFSSAVSANIISITSHGFVTNDPVTFSGTLPGGLVAGTKYFVIRIDVNSIKVSATVSGPAIALTSNAGTGTVIHTPVDPAISGSIGLRLPLELYDDNLAGSLEALSEALLSTIDFTSTKKDPVTGLDVLDLVNSSTLRVTCTDSGEVTNATASAGNSWSVSVFQQGDGEDLLAKEVLLSQNSSVGVAIDITARSLVRVINADLDSPVSAQYLSSGEDLPGKILLESKSQEDVKFYAAISNRVLSDQFTPPLAVNFTINSVSASAVFTTTAAHGLLANDEVYVNDHGAFGGNYVINTVPSATTFTLKGFSSTTARPSPVSGFVYKTDSSSDNNVGPNRLMFSKVGQPEAVPTSNYIDIGPKDKEILRIIALRDNVFVLKQDGIYICSGDEPANFTVRLLDNSAILIAPDSAVVVNNQIYALTTQGVVGISDSGVSIISRPIEDQIKLYTTFNYNYKFTSFGVGYESDRSYLLWLPTKTTDTVATQCFRYNSITNTWTRWTVTSSCGVVNYLGDDKMYLGEPTRNFVIQERKNSERQDYADRDFIRTIGANAVTDKTLRLSSVLEMEAGDVIVQEQYATKSKFNRMLKKLDSDPGVTQSNYYSTLLIAAGSSMNNALQSLIIKLQSDSALSGTYVMPDGTESKESIKASYNSIVNALNAPNSGTSYKNYKLATELLTYEVLTTKVDKKTNSVDLKYMTWLLQGPVTVYKAIKFVIQWAPQHFGKPQEMKQIKDGTLIFDQATITNGIIGYSSDRSEDFVEIEFNMDGPGFWASYDWANAVFGGGSRSTPLRTLVPQNKSRCRYLNVLFKHSNAREQFKLLGISLEERDVSTRAYR